MRALERSTEAAAMPGILFISEVFFMTVLRDSVDHAPTIAVFTTALRAATRILAPAHPCNKSNV
jgi:hypothetical protein